MDEWGFIGGVEVVLQCEGAGLGVLEGLGRRK